MNHAYTIGIAGGSASGKTTLARALLTRLKDFDPVILSQDRYFRDWSDYPEEERDRVRTANRAEAIQWPAYMDAVRKIQAGEPIQEPAPGTRAAQYESEAITIQPGRVLVLEGLFVLYPEELRELLDLAIYVEVDDSERILRRLMRDARSRGGNLERSVAWLRRDVLPNFPTFTGATKQHADLIVPNLQADNRAVQVIAQGVRSILESEDGAEPFTLVEWQGDDPVPQSPWWTSQGWRR
jgi:uridine kinase